MTVEQWIAKGHRVKRGPTRKAQGYVTLAGPVRVKMGTPSAASRGKAAERKMHYKLAA